MKSCPASTLHCSAFRPPGSATAALVEPAAPLPFANIMVHKTMAAKAFRMLIFISFSSCSRLLFDCCGGGRDIGFDAGASRLSPGKAGKKGEIHHRGEFFSTC